MNYAKALRIARAARGISQQDLAEMSGLSKSLLSKIESNSRELSQETKEKVTRALNVSSSLLDILATEPDDSKLSKTELESIGKSLLEIQEELTS